MNKEELLKPRYKVIGLYPHCPFEQGVILIQDEALEWHSLEHGYPESEKNILGTDVEKYPHIFKKLEWFEEREKHELTIYLKDRPESFEKYHKQRYLKVIDSYGTIEFYKALTDGGWVRMPDTLPITEQEYLEFTTNKQTGYKA